MSYDGDRTYLGTFTFAAANVVSTASGAIVAGSALANIPIGEPTFLCSIAAVVTATPSNPPAGVKAYVVIGTSTTTASTTLAQSSGATTLWTFVPMVAIPSGVISVGLVSTGTASATETSGATTILIGLGPQYV